jgi:hypothetical protein
MADIDIYVYPNNSDDDSAAQSIQSTLTDACNNILAGSSQISDYQVNISYEHPGEDQSGRSCDGVDDTTNDISDYISQFKEYRKCHHSEIGCHLGVTTERFDNSSGFADEGDGFGASEDAFVQPRDAVTSGGGEFYENIAIQECFHTFLDKRVYYWDVEQNEHDLGTRDAYGNTQPMATSYYDTHGQHGNCSLNASHSGFTHDSSPCTQRALDATYRSNVNSSPSTGNLWYQAKNITIDEPWASYNLSASRGYPLVIAKPISYAGPQPAHARLKDIFRGSTQFDCRVEEWDYQNDVHYDENVGALIIGSGRIQNDSGGKHIETEAAGEPKANKSWKQVLFKIDFTYDPIVLTMCQTTNDSSAVVTRVQNVTNGSFEVRLQEQESLEEESHAEERVGYLATPAGNDSIDGANYEAGRISGVDHNWHTITFENSYTNPVFLADMQTFNGPDQCNLRYTNLSGDSVDILVDEEESGEDETSHYYSEEVGYFVIEANNN